MWQVRKFDLLISFYIFCVAVSELMGAKTFPLFKIFGFQLNQSVSIFVFPLVFTINDIITEVYGPERTRSIIRASLLVVVLIFLYSLLVTALPASTRFLKSEKAYDEIFGLSARFSFASLMAFIASDFLDVAIFTKIRQSLGKKALWFRNNASNFIAQFVDTTVFMVLAFWAMNQSVTSNIGFIASIALPYWLVKCALSVVETPFVYLGVNWLKSEKDKG